MLRRLRRICRGNHTHQPLLGGRASAAAFYPLPLLRAILEGMNDTAQLENTISDITSENYGVSMLMSLAPVSEATNAPAADAPGELPVQGGGTVKINYSIQDFRPTYLDE